MGQKLKLGHRLRIGILRRKNNFTKLDQYLERVSDKGFDVAAIPFRLLDDLLTSRAKLDFTAITPLARHTVGGQPGLLAAILDGLHDDTQDRLRQIVSDVSAHPVTRF